MRNFFLIILFVFGMNYFDIPKESPKVTQKEAIITNEMMFPIIMLIPSKEYLKEKKRIPYYCTHVKSLHNIIQARPHYRKYHLKQMPQKYRHEQQLLV